MIYYVAEFIIYGLTFWAMHRMSEVFVAKIQRLPLFVDVLLVISLTLVMCAVLLGLFVIFLIYVHKADRVNQLLISGMILLSSGILARVILDKQKKVRPR